MTNARHHLIVIRAVGIDDTMGTVRSIVCWPNVRAPLWVVCISHCRPNKCAPGRS